MDIRAPDQQYNPYRNKLNLNPILLIYIIRATFFILHYLQYCNACYFLQQVGTTLHQKNVEDRGENVMNEVKHRFGTPPDIGGTDNEAAKARKRIPVTPEVWASLHD